MAQGVIGGLALLALLSQAQTSQSVPSQSRSYSVETIRAGAGAPKGAQSKVTVVPGVKGSVFVQKSPVERGPCNMPIIVANPDIDPGMVVLVEQKNVDARIRAAEPSACGGFQKAVGVKR